MNGKSLSPRPDGVDAIVGRWRTVRPELDVSAMQVFGRLHRTYLLYREHINEVFDHYGLNDAGFDVMVALRREPDFTLTAGDLARQTLVTTGGLTLRVRRLEEAGFVTRDRDPHDARVVFVTLTAKGRELIDEVSDAHFDNCLRLLEDFDEERREQLADLLADLEVSLRNAPIVPRLLRSNTTESQAASTAS
ncbi:MarR family winged helix-turn-helix transcriptional regulator [Kocuria sp. M1R5S2]|uniref:MarR family winged helix-turn-helix transcriptional regulator n=1 Tax=Kocuria rhizosphaerae TaxID=3376285 RepID=UPI003793BA93